MHPVHITALRAPQRRDDEDLHAQGDKEQGDRRAPEHPRGNEMDDEGDHQGEDDDAERAQEGDIRVLPRRDIRHRLRGEAHHEAEHREDEGRDIYFINSYTFPLHLSINS